MIQMVVFSGLLAIAAWQKDTGSEDSRRVLASFTNSFRMAVNESVKRNRWIEADTYSNESINRSIQPLLSCDSEATLDRFRLA